MTRLKMSSSFIVELEIEDIKCLAEKGHLTRRIPPCKDADFIDIIISVSENEPSFKVSIIDEALTRTGGK